MMRRLLQPFWVLLAVIFLIEAWLWDHLEPIVERIVAWIPLRAFKQWLSERVDTLSPAMTLLVFAVPVLPLFPLKLVGLWLLANEYWLSAVVVIVLGKLVGVGVTAFIFDVTRKKLLQMAWFKKVYEFILAMRAKHAEHERDEATAKYHHYEIASAAFQIGIVLASATIITGMIVLAWVSGILAIAGIAITALGLYAPHLLHLH